jgi:4-aminobutyrate aminotransferase/(S)-3-amino-2-methylpropionate transaminase
VTASRALLERLREVECPAFDHRRRARAGGAEGPEPIVLARGEGSLVFDVDGKQYVDLAAGFGAVLLGHGHPALMEAVVLQAARLVQGLGDVYASDVKVALLEELASLHPGERPQVLLAQSGSDAVTAALKTATLATGKHGVVAFDGAYHGLGYGPLPACGFAAGFREPFAPQLSPHVRFAPYPGIRGATMDASLGFVSDVLREGTVGAVLVEPIAGRGGCVVPPDAFLVELCKLAHEHDALVIADEIWTGIGRTGAVARSIGLGADIDLLCFGKGLGGGLPIAACIAPAAVMVGWTRAGEVVHTSTHAGAPLACAAALSTLAAVEHERLLERAAEVGARAKEALQDRLQERAVVRGVGFMIGIELADAATAQRAVRELLASGWLVITGGIAGDVLTLTPALTLGEPYFELFGETLRGILDDLS